METHAGNLKHTLLARTWAPRWEPMVCRLFAGMRWIRTVSTARDERSIREFLQEAVAGSGQVSILTGRPCTIDRRDPPSRAMSYRERGRVCRRSMNRSHRAVGQTASAKEPMVCMTHRWRRQSRANSSLEGANSLFAGNLQGISLDEALRGAIPGKIEQ